MVYTQVLNKGGHALRTPSTGCESSYTVCISRRLSRRKQKKLYDVSMTEARGVRRAHTVYTDRNNLPLRDYTDCIILGSDGSHTPGGIALFIIMFEDFSGQAWT
jgi:hypothetical protein